MFKLQKMKRNKERRIVEATGDNGKKKKKKSMYEI